MGMETRRTTAKRVLIRFGVAVFDALAIAATSVDGGNIANYHSHPDDDDGPQFWAAIPWTRHGVAGLEYAVTLTALIAIFCLIAAPNRAVFWQRAVAVAIVCLNVTRMALLFAPGNNGFDALLEYFAMPFRLCAIAIGFLVAYALTEAMKARLPEEQGSPLQ
jgi:hypothetical protein